MGEASVERALGFVAEFNGDPRCSLNAPHAEALASEVLRLRAGIAALEQEMRTVALVAGQCSVELEDDGEAETARRESERCATWADRLAALRDGRG